MSGGVTPTVRVPLNDTVLDRLYINSVDVELNYAVKTLNSMLGIWSPSAGVPGPVLDQNIPNPFRGSTRITYRLPMETFAVLDFFDITGRKLPTIVSRQEKAGTYDVIFNGSPYAPGVYFFRLNAEGALVTRKCVIK